MFELHAVMAEDARRSNQDTNTVMEALLVNILTKLLFDNPSLNNLTNCNFLLEVKILFGTSRQHVEIRTKRTTRRSDGRSMQKERRRLRLIVKTIS